MLERELVGLYYCCGLVNVTACPTAPCEIKTGSFCVFGIFWRLSIILGFWLIQFHCIWFLHLYFIIVWEFDLNSSSRIVSFSGKQGNTYRRLKVYFLFLFLFLFFFGGGVVRIRKEKLDRIFLFLALGLRKSFFCWNPVACENSCFSLLLAAEDVSRGRKQPFLLALRRWWRFARMKRSSSRNVPSVEERVETNLVPRALPPKPGKSALGTRLCRHGCSRRLQLRGWSVIRDDKLRAFPH